MSHVFRLRVFAAHPFRAALDAGRAVGFVGAAETVAEVDVDEFAAHHLPDLTITWICLGQSALEGGCCASLG